MPDLRYWIVCEYTEDRPGVADTLDEAVRIVHELFGQGLADGSLSIEHRGHVVRQFVSDGDGEVIETTGAECQLAAANG